MPVPDVPAMMIDVAAVAAVAVRGENVSDVAAAAAVAMITHHSPTADCVPVHFYWEWCMLLLPPASQQYLV